MDQLSCADLLPLPQKVELNVVAPHRSFLLPFAHVAVLSNFIAAVSVLAFPFRTISGSVVITWCQLGHIQPARHVSCP